jgi:GNAT superfamily N-acetyltransferase
VTREPRARLVLPEDVGQGAAVLSQAFRDDPMVTWMVHGSVHPEAHQRRDPWSAESGFFRPSLDIGRGRGHSYVVEGDDGPRGVAVWAPPGATVFDDTSVVQLIDAVNQHLGGDALARVGSLGDLCRAHHPQDRPHFYLFLLGVSPVGQGWGSPLLAPVLQRCDADGLGAYLESSNSRNHGFYRRHGFEPLWQERPDDTGPTMTGMWREPR